MKDTRRHHHTKKNQYARQNGLGRALKSRNCCKRNDNELDGRDNDNGVVAADDSDFCARFVNNALPRVGFTVKN
ncbi:hypothetical protein DERP_008378 [Dermatophagoides pteronyssinus]|uniref:Uncharacterized protein n=1 Tax=Dermatophagoides pteronyssinus TaxID=6956 RepID=A0ABQ8IV35_DERPT|nr:hypothetical protein DERP_008378 [Dermatophagoides pteronyssinus]